jgi:ABC-type nickel/cobalt efflux system permease component RcnA
MTETYDLNVMREQIEKMSKFNQIEILRVLTRNKVIVNENKNGIHVNMNQLSTELLNELQTYITYVNTQETYLCNMEKQKQEYENLFNSPETHSTGTNTHTHTHTHTLTKVHEKKNIKDNSSIKDKPNTLNGFKHRSKK